MSDSDDRNVTLYREINLGSNDEPFRVRVERLPAGYVMDWAPEGRYSALYVPPEAEVELAMAVCPSVAALVLAGEALRTVVGGLESDDAVNAQVDWDHAILPFLRVGMDHLRRIAEDATDG